MRQELEAWDEAGTKPFKYIALNLIYAVYSHQGYLLLTLFINVFWISLHFKSF